ncbi:MAG: TlpA disulfide reductase family protein [Planctomycetota bacterium]|nr:TlpA disulfide reductase family protein [Planctomycetota bacterium]MDA1213957.1 TlpA disulfide reductase family protein [Planctomycetota bacterium]
MSATFLTRLMFSGITGIGIGVLLAGCGQSSQPSSEESAADVTINAGPSTGSDTASSPSSTKGALPTVSISNAKVNPAGSVDADTNETITIADLEVGSAEWLLREITRLRVQPYPDDKDADRLKEVRRERNLKLIELATEVISQTHEDVEQERLFRLGVHHLMEARMELALSGDKEHIDQLYGDAASLYQRSPSSKAAEEAAYVLVKFAQTNATRFAKQEPRWLEEFARQARMYVSNFPQDRLRGPNALFASAESCELYGRIDEAKVCYALLQQQFPDHLLATQATGILRRIAIIGQPMALGGPTLAGDYWSLDDVRGKTVLIVFWSSNATRFANATETLNSLHRQYSGSGLEIVGVNLDLDEDDVKEFLKSRQIEWPQIFFVEEDQRGWDHPVANYYGIRQVPMYWLVDEQGIVRETNVPLEQLTDLVSQSVSVNEAERTESPAINK